jgi:hypothetical protein
VLLIVAGELCPARSWIASGGGRVRPLKILSF